MSAHDPINARTAGSSNPIDLEGITSSGPQPPGTIPFGSSAACEFARIMSGYVNSYMTSCLTEMQNAQQESAALNSASAILSRFSDGASGDDFDKVRQGLLDAAAQLPPDSPVAAKLRTLADGDTMHSGNDKYLSKPDIASLTSTVSSMAKDMDTVMQSHGLEMQQKMGEQSTIFTTASDLVRSCRDAINAITKNF